MGDIEETLHLLADPIRRELVIGLHDSNERTCTVDQVTEHLNEAVDRNVDAERIRMQLYHHHLPRLEQAGVIDFDKRSGTIRYHEPPPPAIDLIDAVATVCDRHG